MITRDKVNKPQETKSYRVSRRKSIFKQEAQIKLFSGERLRAMEILRGRNMTQAGNHQKE